MAAKFTRIPKVEHLIQSGVPAEVIPTYCALSDYSNNKSGLCWPKMTRLARRSTGLSAPFSGMSTCSLPVAGSSLWSGGATKGGSQVTSTGCCTSPRPPDMGSVWLALAYIRTKELKAFRTPNKHTLQVKIRRDGRTLSSGNRDSGQEPTMRGFSVSDERTTEAFL